MSHIHSLDCCGVKEFAQAQTHFRSAGTLKEDARAALYALLLHWTTQATEHVDSKDELFNKNMLPTRARWQAMKYGGPYFTPRAAHVLFSDHNVKSFKWGEALAEYIVESKLGTVIRTADARNPNTSNVITTFVWTMDPDAVRAWLSQQTPPKSWKKEGTVEEVAGGVTKEFCDEFDEFYQYYLPEQRQKWARDRDPDYLAKHYSALAARQVMQNSPAYREALRKEFKAKLQPAPEVQPPVQVLPPEPEPVAPETEYRKAPLRRAFPGARGNRITSTRRVNLF